MSGRRFDRRAVAAIVRKDLSVVRQSKAVMLPLILVPLLMLVVIPLAIGLGAAYVPSLGADLMSDLQRMLEAAPEAVLRDLRGLDPAQQIVVLALGYFIAPMYLIVPLMVSSVIAADSFAGERERGTMEALLYTPTNDRELFLAKALAAWLPATAVGIAGGVAYILAANVAAWPTLGRPFLPTLVWIALILWVGPAVAALGLSATVWVSARVDTFQEAYQLGGVLVLPIIALVVAQATGLLYLSGIFVVLLGAIAWALAVVLLRAGARRFTRDELASRM